MNASIRANIPTIFCSLAAVAVAVVACVALLGRETMVHIVEVDKDGAVVNTQKVLHASPSVSDAIYRSAIHDWVVAFRSIAADVRVQSDRMDKTVAHLRTDDPAYNIVYKSMLERNSFVTRHAQAAYVTVDRIQRVGPATWYVAWTERTTDLSDETVTLDTHSATLYMQQGQVGNDKMIHNPLGIYVVELDLNRPVGDTEHSA